MASKDFGGSQTEPSKNARQFILVILQSIATKDLEVVYQFLASNLSELNESLGMKNK
ncbi:MAG: hypothetical protein ACK5C4_13150 [Pseudanabaena sp.]|jgi:hypothetical protein